MKLGFAMKEVSWNYKHQFKYTNIYQLLFFFDKYLIKLRQQYNFHVKLATINMTNIWLEVNNIFLVNNFTILFYIIEIKYI